MAKFFPAFSFSLLPSLLCPFLSSIQKCNSFCSQLTSFVISKENHRFQVQKGFLTCDQINLHIHFPLKFVFCFNLPSFSHLTFHLWILVGGVRRECNQISFWAECVLCPFCARGSEWVTQRLPPRALWKLWGVSGCLDDGGRWHLVGSLVPFTLVTLLVFLQRRSVKSCYDLLRCSQLLCSQEP